VPEIEALGQRTCYSVDKVAAQAQLEALAPVLDSWSSLGGPETREKITAAFADGRAVFDDPQAAEAAVVQRAARSLPPLGQSPVQGAAGDAEQLSGADFVAADPFERGLDHSPLDELEWATDLEAEAGGF
jgi:hypothetical protein